MEIPKRLEPSGGGVTIGICYCGASFHPHPGKQKWRRRSALDVLLSSTVGGGEVVPVNLVFLHKDHYKLVLSGTHNATRNGKETAGVRMRGGNDTFSHEVLWSLAPFEAKTLRTKEGGGLLHSLAKRTFFGTRM